jgi:hypothetical protein
MRSRPFPYCTPPTVDAEELLDSVGDAVLDDPVALG